MLRLNKLLTFNSKKFRKIEILKLLDDNNSLNFDSKTSYLVNDLVKLYEQSPLKKQKLASTEEIKFQLAEFRTKIEAEKSKESVF